VIYQLIFTCALAKTTSEDMVASFARQTVDHSLKNDVTGIAVCMDGCVLQVLEGNQEQVTELYTSVAQNPHTTNTLILLKRELSKREFQNWSMGCKYAPNTPNTFNLNSTSFSKELPRIMSPELNTITETFARINGL